MSVRQRAAFFESNPTTTPRLSNPRLENASQGSSEHQGPAEGNSGGWRGRPKSAHTASASSSSDTARGRESFAEERTPIVMIDNAEFEDRSAVLNSSNSLALVEASPAVENRRSSPENFWENLQKQTTKTLSPDEVGRKLSQTFDPVVSFVKDNAEKTALAAKPALATAGRGIETMQTSVRSAVDKTGVPTAFQKTADDFADLAARVALLYNGGSGVCSKCRKLPIDLLLSGSQADESQSELKWASPLSRIIYHAEWCRICRLLLEMFCKPVNDPLKHSAVAPHLQSELASLTMQEWVSKGWKYTDEHWPFGHGAKRHEGASYVLGPAGDAFGKILTRAILLSNQRNRHHRPDDRARQERRHRQELREAKNPPQYPLSCLVNISTLGSQSPGLLMVNLLGYGRKLGADLQLLSSFRLRAIPTTAINSLVPHLRSADRVFSYGRVLNPDWIDPSIGRLWLSECEHNHGSACNDQAWGLTMRRPPLLRVIDVENLCIKEINILDPVRYVALSYVWGSAEMVKLLLENKQDMGFKHSLLKIFHLLPRTIVGAIEVVKAIGERYLWNDALCIVQNDPEEIKEHVGFMDAVYGSALATIISADGSSANSGLEGVQLRNLAEHNQLGPTSKFRGRPRLRGALSEYRKEVLTDDVSIAAPLETTDHNLSHSIWNSRAWTFQERLLSRRLIIFSHGHMVWHCRGMICREDMTVADSGVNYNSLQWLSLDPRSGDNPRPGLFFDGSIERTRYGTTRLVRSARFVEYAKAVEEYTHRQMSHQTDILNAFAGLGRIFSMALQSESYFGLPAKSLDVALLWRPTQRLKRRSGFPSWSWAGWVGQVAYNKPYDLRRSVDGKFLSFGENPYGEEGVRPLIRWNVLGTSPINHLVDLNDLHALVQPVNGTGLGFPYSNEALPTEWENGPWHTEVDSPVGEPRRARPVPNNVFNDRAPGNIAQQLIFWASCTTKLHLGQSISQPSDQAWIRTDLPPARYWIVDSDSYAVGNVLLDSEDNKASSDLGRYGFIQIAEAQYAGLDNEERDVEDYPLYVVMLVEWDDQRQVAERRGIGRVNKEAWKLMKPRMKLVRLQ
jgi:hypothetical protein